MILGQKDVEFRATKDLDMVLIIEAVNDSFVRKFISFISDAGYQHIVKGKVEQIFHQIMEYISVGKFLMM